MDEVAENLEKIFQVEAKNDWQLVLNYEGIIYEIDYGKHFMDKKIYLTGNRFSVTFFVFLSSFIFSFFLVFYFGWNFLEPCLEP